MSTELANFLDKRPKWLQTAAFHMLQGNKRLVPKEIEALVDLCLKETDETDSPDFASVPKELLASGMPEASIRIERIDRPVGVNALSSKSYVDAGESNILLVFGPNGSGKSSYARFLKKACGINTNRSLLKNAFNSSETKQSAVIRFRVDDAVSEQEWETSGKPIQALRTVSIFDEEIASSYIASSIEAAQEPFSLRFISRLISVCDAVRAELKTRKASLPSKLPAIPSQHQGTEAFSFYESLLHSTEASAIEKACTWTEKDLDRKNVLDKSLNRQDALATLAQLKKNRDSLSRLKQYWSKTSDEFSHDRVSKIVDAKKEQRDARIAADEAAKKVFADAQLDGVGSKTWKSLWEAARTFSESSAYPEHSFPHTDGVCVLCHQSFANDADRNRMESFEDFVNSELESKAGKAKEHNDALIAKLPQIDEEEPWLDRFSNTPVDAGVLLEARKKLSDLRTLLSANDVQTDLKGFADSQIAPAIENRLVSVTQEIELLEKASNDEERLKLESELRELNARQWVASQRDAIDSEVSRLKAVSRLDNASKTTDTSLLTALKNKLAQTDLVGSYQTRFGVELARLGANTIKIEPRGRSLGKGKFEFDMQLAGVSKNLKTSEILSEGEKRVVALSAFLADMSLKDTPAPFIFDDPITSLDQDYEEKVVERLVQLAQERQVIIFTHRLSLKSLVEEEVRKTKAAAAWR